jgi:hypothetical protein
MAMTSVTQPMENEMTPSSDNALNDEVIGDADATEIVRMKKALNKGLRSILEHPFGKVCKHWMIAQLMSELEAAGFPQPDGFVKAVVEADDFTALSYPDFFDENCEPVQELESPSAS